MSSKVKCTCGWSWNKSDSSVKDMYICHECGRDNSNNMKNGGWLDNYNDYEVSAPEGMIGNGLSNVGRNSSPAWGGQFQEGGKLKFLQPTSDKLPEGYVIPYDTPSTERAGSIGGENGEPAYLIPEFKYGKLLDDPMGEFKKTGEHLGGPFKTWQEADKWENETRHPAVEKGENIMFPQEKFQVGGTMPGAVGHMYARTGAPSKGPRRNQTDVTDASAQNGKEMQYYQQGLDWKPKSISKDGAWLDDYDVAQTGKTVEYGTPEYTKAWKEGKVQMPNVNGEDVPYWGGELDEVLIKRNKKDKNFLEKYRDRIIEENKDASILGAIIGAPISAVSSLPQMAITSLFNDGNPARPSEVIGFDNNEGLFESPASFGKHASNFVLDAVTDPTNLIGAGILTKENALAKLSKIPTSIAPELRQGLRTAGIAENLTSSIKSGVKKGGEFITDAMNKKIGPEFSRRILPDDIEPFAEDFGLTNKMVGFKAVGSTASPDVINGDVLGYLNLHRRTNTVFNPATQLFENANPEWFKPGMIEVAENMQGHQMQDALYQLGIDEAKKRGLKGVVSGEQLLSPAKTAKAHQRFEKEIFGSRTTNGIDHDIAGLTQHMNPNVVADFMEKYKSLPKHIQERYSLKEYIQMSGKAMSDLANKELSLGTTAAVLGVPIGGIAGTLGYSMYDYNKSQNEMEEYNRKYDEEIKRINEESKTQTNKKNGGIIKDDRGQWDHPGEITEIGSNQITMQGVPYPVLGISDTGDTQMMYPEEDYEFDGEKVTEYPMAQPGVKIFKKQPFKLKKEQNIVLRDNTNINQKVISTGKRTSTALQKKDAHDKANPKVVVFAEAPYLTDYKYSMEDKNLPKNFKKMVDDYERYSDSSDAGYGKIQNNKEYRNLLTKYDALDNIYKQTKSPKDSLALNKLEKEFNESWDTLKNKYVDPWDIKKKKEEDKFYDKKNNPKVTTRTEEFIIEANNVKDFYKRTSPRVNVDVVPMYEQQKLLQNKLASLSPYDKAVIFGHSGDELAGLPNDTIAKYVNQCSAEDFYIGSCFFENHTSPYKKAIKNKTIHYRPDDPWLGFNPNAETFDEGMWSRAYNDSVYPEIPEIVPLKKGFTHTDVKLKDGGCTECSKKAKNGLRQEQKGLQNLDNLVNFTNYNTKQPGGWLEKFATGGSVTEVSPEEYTIEEGNTLFEIARDKNIPLSTLAAANKIENPDLIKTGNKLAIPKQFKKELSFNEIPTTDNKKVVIDNFSPHYDYIIEGDKTYYKVKSGNTWADISNNKQARANLTTFLDKNNYWAGYGSGEKAKYDKVHHQPVVVPGSKIPKTQPSIIKNTETGNKPIIVKRPIAKVAKEEPSFFDDISDVVSSSVKSLETKWGDVKKETKNIVKDVENTISSGLNNAISTTEDAYHTVLNGIERKFKTHTGQDDDAKVTTKVNLNPKTVKEWYGNKSGAEITQVIDAPNTNGRTYKQQVLPASNIKFGVRNRGEYKDINTDGLEVTTFNPFTKDKLPDETSVLAIDGKGNLHTGQYKDFKGQKDFMFSKTFRNKIIDFPEVNGKGEYVSGEKSGNPKYQQPKIKVLDDNGKVINGSLNILVKDDSKKDYYGQVQGGRILFVNPTTKEQYLVSGSISHIKQKFKELKGNNKYLEAYTLDNGTYSRGLSYKDKKLTKDRLKSYDLENTGGGNGLYILDYKQPVSKYEEDYIDNMPNVRTKNDTSYKKGHALKNEVKNIVLHHTAYTGPNAEKELNKQYMTPGQNSSHIVIQENGKRSVYASPEQVTFHAGESEWNKRKDVNDFSIGVEFQGDTNKKPLTQAQIESFVEYYAPIAKKYNLSLKDIITHQMIAPGRKPDINEKQYARILKYMTAKNFK